MKLEQHIGSTDVGSCIGSLIISLGRVSSRRLGSHSSLQHSIRRENTNTDNNARDDIREFPATTCQGRMPSSSIWGHPNQISGPSPSKAHLLEGLGNGTSFTRDSSRATSIGTPTKNQTSQQHQQSYQQSQPSPFPQQPYNPRLSTSSASSNGSVPPEIPMSPGQNSMASTSAGGGASSLGMGHDGLVYLSAASSLTGGSGLLNGNSGGAEGREVNHAGSGYTVREHAGYEGYEGNAPMQMPINLEEDEDMQPYPRGQGFSQIPTSGNPSINFFQHSDTYLDAHQSQPVSIPFPSPGRLGPGSADQYDHSGHQMYAGAPGGGPDGSAGNGNRTLQQPSPSRSAGPTGTSISPLPWGRNNGFNPNVRQQTSTNGGMQSRGGMGSQNAPNGFERPTSAMSGRGHAYGEPAGHRESYGKDSNLAAPNADGLQGLGIARAESPAMAVSPLRRFNLRSR